MTKFGVEIAPAPQHAVFVRNLLAASHAALNFALAVLEWYYRGFGFDRDRQTRCHLCNQRIMKYVVLGNGKNGNVVVVGNDCYDKFLGYLRTGKVESQLGERKQLIREIKIRWKAGTDERVLGWFQEQFDVGRVPSELEPLVSQLLALGFPPSIEVADQLVVYYKTTRKFPVDILVPGASRWRCGKWLPSGITISQTERLKALIERDREREKSLEAAREEAEYREMLNKLESKEISELLFVNGESFSYSVVQNNGRWEQTSVYFHGEAPVETGLYQVKLLKVWGKVDALLVGLAPDSVQRIGRFDFNLESNRPMVYHIGRGHYLHRTAYVARAGSGKMIIPVRNVYRPGSYEVFMVRDEGRFYRVWVL